MTGSLDAVLALVGQGRGFGNVFTEALLAVAAILGAITVVGGGLYKLYGLTKRIEETIGVDREGMTLADRVREATASLSDHVNQADKILNKVDSRVAHLEESIEPEGSPSLVTRMNRAEHDLVEIKTHVDRVGAKVDVLSGLLRSDIRERKESATDE